MKRYFLHDGHEQTGPFVFEELRRQSLTPELMVWHDGIPNWVNITLLEELKPLLKSSTPPPFKGVGDAPAAEQVAAAAIRSQQAKSKIPNLNMSKLTIKRVFIAAATCVLIVFIILFIASPKKGSNNGKTNKIRIGKSPRSEQGDKDNYSENDSKSAKYGTGKSGKNSDGDYDENNKGDNESSEQRKEADEKKIAEETERANPLRFIEGEGNSKQNLWGGKIIVSGTIKNKATVLTYTDFIIEISYLSAKKTFISSEKQLVKEPVYAGEEIDFRFKLDLPEGAKSCVWKVTSASVGKSYRKVK